MSRFNRSEAGFSGKTSDLAFLTEALKAQDQSIRLQNSQLDLAVREQGLKREQYEFQKKQQHDSLVQQGRSQAAKALQQINADDPEALEQLQTMVGDLPIEVMSDPGIRQSISLIQGNIKSREDQRAANLKADTDNANQFLKTLAEKYPESVPATLALSANLVSGDMTPSAVRESASAVMAQSAITKASKVLSEVTDKKQFVKSMNIPLPVTEPLQGETGIDEERVYERALESFILGIPIEDFNSLSSVQKLSLIPRIESKSQAFLEQATKKKEKEQAFREKQEKLAKGILEDKISKINSQIKSDQDSINRLEEDLAAIPEGNIDKLKRERKFDEAEESEPDRFQRERDDINRQIQKFRESISGLQADLTVEQESLIDSQLTGNSKDKSTPLTFLNF